MKREIKKLINTEINLMQRTPLAKVYANRAAQIIRGLQENAVGYLNDKTRGTGERNYLLNELFTKSQKKLDALANDWLNAVDKTTQTAEFALQQRLKGDSVKNLMLANHLVANSNKDPQIFKKLADSHPDFCRALNDMPAEFFGLTERTKGEIVGSAARKHFPEEAAAVDEARALFESYESFEKISKMRLHDVDENIQSQWVGSRFEEIPESQFALVD